MTATSLERSYRSLLRLLPADYRAQWEEEMVATFLECSLPTDPEDAEIASLGRPSAGEAASIVSLALRLRLGGAASAPRAFLWGEAVRRVALLALLLQAISGPMLLLSNYVLASLGVPAVTHALEWQIRDVIGLASTFGCLGALLALLWSHRRVAQVLAPVGLLADVVVGVMVAGFAPSLGWIALHLCLPMCAVAALAAFHREAPPVARRPWLWALVGGVLAWPVLTFATSWIDPWIALPLSDSAGAWAVGFVAVALAALSGPLAGKSLRSPSWALALALLAPAVLLGRLSAYPWYGSQSVEMQADMARAGVMFWAQVLAIGLLGSALAVRAWQGGRRLPAGPSANRPTALA